MPPVQTLTCSNCGAALATTAPPGATLTCDYCGTPLVVPARTGPPTGEGADMPAARAGARPPGPEPEPEPIVVPPERITVIPPGGRARGLAGAGSSPRFSLYLALLVLLCCGLPLATALLCIATGLVGGPDLR
jgi:hypothetical protein